MTIRLKPEQEHRVAEALRSGAYSSTDDVIDRALEVLHEQDEWLMANREANDAKIRAGIEKNWNEAKVFQKMSWTPILHV